MNQRILHTILQILKHQKQPPEVFYIKGCSLKKITKFTRKQLCQSLYFNKFKETLPQVFSCEFCEIFKNTFFTEHLQMTQTTASETFKNK